MKKTLVLLLVIATFQASLLAETRSERKARERAESEETTQVQGGALFTVEKPYDAVYAAALHYVKTQGYIIDEASKESGQITTSIAVTGGWRQQGRRTIITVISEDENTTSVRALVTLQKRYKALQVEPWSDPVADDKSSTALRIALSTAIDAD